MGANCPHCGKPLDEPKASKRELAAWFDEEFWPAYPKKIGKAAARKKVLSLAPDEGTRRKIISSLAQQCTTEDWRKEGGQFIPHPTTWLNQGRWDDEGVQLPSRLQEKTMHWPLATTCDVDGCHHRCGTAMMRCGWHLAVSEGAFDNTVDGMLGYLAKRMDEGKEIDPVWAWEKAGGDPEEMRKAVADNATKVARLLYETKVRRP